MSKAIKIITYISLIFVFYFSGISLLSKHGVPVENHMTAYFVFFTLLVTIPARLFLQKHLNKQSSK